MKQLLGLAEVRVDAINKKSQDTVGILEIVAHRHYGRMGI